MYTLPSLPYAYDVLEPYIDEKTMRIHHDKHHAAYVNNLNDALKDSPQLLSLSVEQLMSGLNKVPDIVRTKVRNNGGGHANHSLFWKIMGPAKDEEPKGQLVVAINNTFGSLINLQEKMNTSGLGRFGSGWVWLVANPSAGSGPAGLEVMDTPNQDTPLMEHKSPILGIDVWEHAYYLKYQNLRADYLKAFWHVVNWQTVAKNYNEALKV